MENKLQVRDLTISFRTSNGKVQAVRGINFDLAKGETLSIVGESGSGKSVTSKAILGILAGNSIVEGGEIIYDGKDLLKISEDEFHKIRGDKIAMIFQDPMSSLNPIVKIGRQLTEAMILKGKARQKESRANFNTYMEDLNKSMIEAVNGANAAELSAKCKNFDQFERKHLDLEGAYNEAHAAAGEAVENIDVLAFELEKKGAKDVPYRVNEIIQLAKKSVHEYVVKVNAEKVNSLCIELKGEISKIKNPEGDATKAITALKELGSILKEAVDKTAPNFFAMGYCLTFGKEELPQVSVEELNAYMRKYLDDNFMLDFIADAKKGIMHAAEISYNNKVTAIAELKKYLPVFEEEHLNEKKCNDALKAMAAAVKATINKLELVKDSLTYTFESGMKDEMNKYFGAEGKNKKAQAKYDAAKAKYDRQVARGKVMDYVVPAAQIIDQELLQKNMIRQITRLIEHYEESLAKKDLRDYDAETVAAIDYLKANASGVVNKVTKRIAKRRAIKLMEEVGIAEPRKRFNQYPFEFSGGMRQRIVIAIALAADPDILICDEPTTALDVTIQSQILELINKLKKERQLSIIFITHDLGVVANMADRIAVMYAGKIVEYGTAEDVFYDAAHPYTWALLSSMPDLDTDERLEAIPGTPPNMIYPPVGDAFAARNKYAMKIDFERQPPMFQVSDTHYAATWLLHPDAPKVDKPKIITDRIARMKQKGSAQDAE
jgi:oligopeptide/dipeptide ABC transporter ATP-binding protein